MNKGKVKAFVLVRDEYGNPKFDNFNNIPNEIWNTLSEKDKKYIYKKRKE